LEADEEDGPAAESVLGIVPEKKVGHGFLRFVGGSQERGFYYRNEWTRNLGRQKAERTNVARGRML
jgi:hypothetical protein